MAHRCGSRLLQTEQTGPCALTHTVLAPLAPRLPYTSTLEPGWSLTVANATLGFCSVPCQRHRDFAHDTNSNIMITTNGETSLETQSFKISYDV